MWQDSKLGKDWKQCSTSAPGAGCCCSARPQEPQAEVWTLTSETELTRPAPDLARLFEAQVSPVRYTPIPAWCCLVHLLYSRTWPPRMNQLSPNQLSATAVSRKLPSRAVARNCGMGSSPLNADVKAFDKLH